MAPRNKSVQWLEGELRRWVRNGIIDNAHAQAIRQLYPVEQSARPWALMVFSGIGAVIIGLGVILLFAYNWQYMTKFAKLSIIFSALAAAHIIGVWLFLRSERFRTLGEAFTVLGTMFFGAGIWLVAQIYHIQEHFPTAFFFWGLGALALAWAMPSIAQAIIAAVLFTIWAVVEAVEFQRAMPEVVPILLLLWLLAYLKRSRILIGVLILALGFSTAFVTSVYIECPFVFNVLLSIAVIYLSLGFLVRRYGKFPESAPVFHVFGFAAYLVMLYLLTFPIVFKEIFSANSLSNADILSKPENLLYWLLPAAVALAGWIMVGWLVLPWSSKPRLKDCPYDSFLIPLLLILYYSHTFFVQNYNYWTVTMPFNLVFLAHAGSMMARGCRDGKLGPAILGSLMLVALTVARYADLFESLVARGIVFIIVGILLFGQGLFYVRSKRKQAKGETL